MRSRRGHGPKPKMRFVEFVMVCPKIGPDQKIGWPLRRIFRICVFSFVCLVFSFCTRSPPVKPVFKCWEHTGVSCGISRHVSVPTDVTFSHRFSLAKISRRCILNKQALWLSAFYGVSMIVSMLTIGDFLFTTYFTALNGHGKIHWRALRYLQA